jgi:hypothetical protein
VPSVCCLTESSSRNAGISMRWTATRIGPRHRQACRWCRYPGRGGRHPAIPVRRDIRRRDRGHCRSKIRRGRSHPDRRHPAPAHLQPTAVGIGRSRGTLGWLCRVWVAGIDYVAVAREDVDFQERLLPVVAPAVVAGRTAVDCWRAGFRHCTGCTATVVLVVAILGRESWPCG